MTQNNDFMLNLENRNADIMGFVKLKTIPKKRFVLILKL